MDEEHCLYLIKEVMGYLPSGSNEESPYCATSDPFDRKTEELLDIVPEKSNRVYDMYKIIKAIVDDGKYLPLKPFFGKALITCFARMGGRTVGIVASQPMHNAGAAGPDECDKATSFIVLCDCYNIPLFFLTDTPGFLVGREAEIHKIPRKIMVWLRALQAATVPKLSLIARKSYGMAYNNMCGNICNPDVLIAWPTADISFMAPEVAANVAYFKQLQESKNPQADREMFIREMQYGSTPWKAAEKSLLDNVIDPCDTRKYIIQYSPPDRFWQQHRSQG